MRGVQIDVTQLAARMLRPDRPRLAEARAAVAGIDDAREAWEVLVGRGLLRASALAAFDADAIRCPWCSGAVPRRGDERCVACAGRAALCVPDEPTRVGGIALAADPAGVATTEALAFEVVARLGLWGYPAPTRAVWCPGRPLAATSGARMRLHELAINDAWEADPKGALESWVPFDALRGQPVYADVAAAATWQNAVRTGLKVSAMPTRPASLIEGRAYATLPDPFEPLLAIWQLGYVLDAFSDDVIVLIAPPVPDEV